MMWRAALALALAAAPVGAQEAAEAPGAILRVLDKVAGVTQDFTLGADETAFYGNLEITMADCRYPAENPASDAYAHITVFDTMAQITAFDGWMVASSPALSALDHPRYDVWVLRCDIPAVAAEDSSSDG